MKPVLGMSEEDEIMCKSVEEYAERKAEEAAKEEKKSTANNLYNMGMDMASIAKAVNIDEKTVEKWLKK